MNGHRNSEDSTMIGNAASPRLEYLFELRVSIGPTLEIASTPSGLRRPVPILGGTFSGDGLTGRILPGGADWQLVAPDGCTWVDARYVLETDDGVRIEVQNQGLRYAPSEVLKRLESGEPVSPDAYYFRTTPRFFPPPGRYQPLGRSVFVGSGERYADLVVVRVWRVH